MDDVGQSSLARPPARLPRHACVSLAAAGLLAACTSVDGGGGADRTRAAMERCDDCRGAGGGGCALLAPGGCRWPGAHALGSNGPDVCCIATAFDFDLVNYACCAYGDAACAERVRAQIAGEERCDHLDNNCNGVVDDAPPAALGTIQHCAACNDDCQALWRVNAVGACVEGACAIASCHDGFEDVDGEAATGCEHDVPGPDDIDDDRDGHVLAIDCDDTDPRVHPGAAESCDGTDEDCNREVDETGACAGAADPCATVQCHPGRLCDEGVCRDDFDGDESPVPDDCDDRRPAIHPGADETCDGRDDNCDAEVDEGCDYTQSCVAVEPPSIDFGDVPAREPGAPGIPRATVVVRRCGDAPAVVHGARRLDGPGFRIGFDPDLPIPLGTFEITVDFYPTEPGVYRGGVVLRTSDARHAAIEIPMTGTVVP
jgi:hypothetical protein